MFPSSFSSFVFVGFLYYTNSIQICQTLRNHSRRLVNRRLGSRMFERTRTSPIEFYRKCGEWVDGVSSLGVCDCGWSEKTCEEDLFEKGKGGTSREVGL